MRQIIVSLAALILSFSMFSQVSWNVDSVYNWYDSSIPRDGRNRTYNEVWGFEINAREYAVIGSRQGAYIIDVTRVLDPKLVKFIPGAYNDATNRDYHDYNGYLYMVCDQGPSTLQIVDLHNLPYEAPVIYDSDSILVRCHNIFIDTATEHLYACSVFSNQDSLVDLQVFDISDGPIPKHILTYDNEQIDGFHDIFVKNDTAFGNNGRTGLFMYDFSDVDNPEIIGSILDYPDQGYNHAGYATEDGEYYYFSDETHGTDMKAVKVNDYSNARVIGTFNSGLNTEEIVVHNLLVRDNLLFVSYYHEGLQIFDLTDPRNPKKAGRYVTYTDEKDDGSKDYSGYSGAWGVYPYLPSGYILVSDREKGLFIFLVT